MADSPQARQYLAALKLSGMLSTLDARLAEAEAEQLTYLDFLGRLLEDEMRRRAGASLGVRLARAHADRAGVGPGRDASVDELRERLLSEG